MIALDAGKSRKSILAMLMTITLCLGMLAGCSQSTTGTGDGAGANGPSTISLMIPYWVSEAPKPNSDALKIIQDYTHTKLEITWVPATSYTDKLNAVIAGGQLPQILYATAGANRLSGLVSAVRSGMFWDITPYLKDYPNLSKLDPDLLKQSTIDGKVYGVFKSFPQARDGIIIRKDWLDNLGLPEPKTIADLQNVMKSFTNNDPDKNGKNDTFGFASSGQNNGMSGFGSWLSWYGGPNGWEVQNGKLVPDFLTPEYMEVMKLYKDMYQQKVFNQDFAAAKSNVVADLFNQGKVGVYFGPLDDIQTRFSSLYKAFPNAQVDVISRIEGPKGARVPSRGVFPPEFMFPKTSIQTEAGLKQILSFLDKMADKKIQDLLSWGIEGVHYKLDNGKPVVIDAVKYTDDIGPFTFLSFDTDSQSMKGDLPAVVQKALQMQIDNKSIMVPNPTQSLISTTQIEKSSTLDNIIGDARAKFIMGQIDENGWNQAVAQWRSQGGDKIIEEYTTEYNKYNK